MSKIANLPLFIFFFLTICTGYSQTFWSNPATWGGTKPVAGDSVIITAGMHVILDEDTPSLGTLTIEGQLDFANQDLNLTSRWILVTGQLNVGSEAAHYMHQAVFTLTGTDVNEVVIDGIKATRGIIVRGGILELHGNPPAIPWTKINANAPQGSTSLTLMESVNWQVGDEIVIAPTDFYEAGLAQNSVSQQATLTSASGSSLAINQGLNAFRWGVLQYATATGMSLSPLNRITPPTPNTGNTTTPTILDERAAVGNLSRNILIQAPNDNAWNNEGLGVHVMVARSTSGHNCDENDVGHQGVAHIDGVEFSRAGQRGRLGRYPFHWHMMSYCGTQTLEDATGQYLRNSSIHNSQHRAVVIHGTNGVEVSNNVIYDIKSHAIFTEDGAERRNILDGNLVLHIRNHANAADGLRFHERNPSNRTSGSCGFWLSNPDNVVRNNTAADCTKNGFWLSFPPTPIGLNVNIPIQPNRLRFGVFENNTAHSNGIEGIRRDNAESAINPNSFGPGAKYISTSDGQNPSGGEQLTRESFLLKGYVVWKNGISGIWDRSDWSRNYECVSADNQARFFAGAGKDGYIKRSLVIGTSLNHLMNGTGRSNVIFGVEPAPSAFATYHSDFSIQDNIVINFPAEDNIISGVFATNDYYIRGVEKGQALNTNNTLVDCSMGVKVMALYPWFALSGALWDPYAKWGTILENYIVYDTPFYTYNQTVEILLPNAEVVGAVGTAGPYYGFGDFAVNKPLDPRADYWELQVERLDASLNNVVGVWHVGDAQATSNQGTANKRHFATHPSSAYQLFLPSVEDAIYDIAITTNNFLSADDKQVVAIPYAANATILQVFSTSSGSYMDDDYALTPSSATKHNYTAVSNRQAVVDSDGETYWHDTVNELVWMKVQGGMEGGWHIINAINLRDETVYKQFYIRIHGIDGALPINLINFSAHLNTKNEVDLQWSTATEIDNDYFTVERSGDGENWITINKISAAGTSQQVQSYQSTDKTPMRGTSYYRLKQTDINNKFSYSQVEVINYNKNFFFNIHPNPTNNFVRISFEKDIEKGIIDIKNVNGKSVFTTNIQSLKTFDINTSAFANGIYFISLTSQHEVYTLPLVKQ